MNIFLSQNVLPRGRAQPGRFGFRSLVPRCLMPVLLSLTVAGCLDRSEPNLGEQGEDHRAHVTARISFSDAFRHQRTIVPEQTDDVYLVRPTHAALSSDGHLAVADPSEGNIKLFYPDGRLRAVLGRKGGGPGELINGRVANFTASGDQVVVFDRGRNVALRFTLDGELIAENLLEISVWAAGGLNPTGSAVVGIGSDRRIVHVLNERFDVIASHLPIHGIRPEREPESPLWGHLDAFGAAVINGEVLVTSQLSDTLWVVNTTTGSVQRYAVSFNERVPLRPPRNPPGNMEEVVSWIEGLQVAVMPVAAKDFRGILFRSGPRDTPEHTLVGSIGDTWAIITDPPHIVASGDFGVLAQANPGEADIRYDLYSTAGLDE
jgi:hypothetical protein